MNQAEVKITTTLQSVYFYKIFRKKTISKVLTAQLAITKHS